MTAYIINPNSTVAMTDAMLSAVRTAAPGLAWQGRTAHGAPPAIQGAADGEAAAPHLLREIAAAADDGATGIVVGCFDDTALAQAAASVACPVIGIGQAAFHYCALRNWRFSVVTTLPISIPVIEANIGGYGLSGHLGRVRASGVPVLDLETARDLATVRIVEEAKAAVREDAIDAVILGCAGMVNVIAALRASLSIPVVDPVEAAAGCLVWMQAPGPGTHLARESA